MANNFDLSVQYTATCGSCGARKSVAFQSAGSRPYNAADHFKDQGWVYRNASGWTCDNCTMKNPADRKRMIAGLETQLKHAVELVERSREQVAKGYGSARYVRSNEQTVAEITERLARFRRMAEKHDR